MDMTLAPKTLSLLLGSALLAPAVAQDPDRNPDMARPAEGQHRVLLETLMDTAIQLQPTAAAKAEAREDGERAEGEEVGIAELIATPDLKFKYAVLSVGGVLGIGDKHVVVAWDDVSREMVAGEDGTKVLRMRLPRTVKELEAARPFDLDKAKESGLEHAVKNYMANRDSDEDGGSTAKPSERGTDEASAKKSPMKPSMVCVSALGGAHIKDATRQNKGTIDRLILCPAAASISFGVVALDDDDVDDVYLLVPAEGLEPEMIEEELSLRVPVAGDEMVSLLHYAEPESARGPIAGRQAEMAKQMFDKVAKSKSGGSGSH